ncbi:MAG: hypothetical protein K5925_00380 [Bacilli bacterium]|nr:hypothetical protein [Bacilli bacterium]
MEELNNIYFYNSEIGEYKVCSDEKTVNPNRFHSDEELIYSKDEKSNEIYADQSIYKNSETARITRFKKGKSTAKITTLAAALVASSLGIVTVLNPLLIKPKVSNGKYSVVNGVLNYSFKLSKMSNYTCALLLYCDEQEVYNLDLPQSKTYTGEIMLAQYGTYRLELYSANKIDYIKRDTLYTFAHLS